ncbi:MAG: hypothetical protein SOZ80_08410 [Prevotella sp.]|uniref:hypothetical protein n=1 Tax=Prevotella sp. TaxID=59823 RepID=UPI002A2E109E|nr:hypothetical protein [Prevotella sp.]MDD7318998.1 hypothetical protein [Prevotellaceae bacterium]MDY4020778.1 hypothetical protein [Prevotella sp.]
MEKLKTNYSNEQEKRQYVSPEASIVGWQENIAASPIEGYEPLITGSNRVNVGNNTDTVDLFDENEEEISEEDLDNI